MSGIEAAAIGALGGFAEAGLGYIGQRNANRANIAHSREQMAFQERMSSTAIQRMRQDAEKAGINPLYWLQRAGGASSPTGSMPNINSTLEGVKGTTAKSLEARMNSATVKNLEAQNSQILSQVAVNLATAKEVLARTNNVNAQTERYRFEEDVAKEARKGVHSAKSVIDQIGEGVGSLGHAIFGSKIEDPALIAKRLELSRKLRGDKK